MKIVAHLLASAVAAAVSAPAMAQCTGKSPAHTLALVELYTSEGCDSCPPADPWLRTLRADTGVARASLQATLPGASPGGVGVVAFVQNRKSGEVLQAFSLPLCPA